MIHSEQADVGLLPELFSDTWQAALGEPPSSSDEDFFAAGGDSLLIVRIVTQLRQNGVAAHPADILRGRTFDGILDLLRDRNSRDDSAGQMVIPTVGAIPLLPTQARWMSDRFADPDHFVREWVFEVPPTTPHGEVVDAKRIEAAIRALIDRHEALRTRYFLPETGNPRAEVLPQAPDTVLETVITDDAGVVGVLKQGLASLRLADGRVIRAVWLPRQRLLQLVVHNLTMDGYSLSLVADQLEGLLTGRRLAPAVSQPRDYAADLTRWLASSEAASDATRWASLGWADVRRIPTDTAGPGLLPSMVTASAKLDAEQTAALQQAARELGRPVDLFVAVAAGRTIADHFQLPAVSVDTYHHGRDGVPGGHDLTETIGYLQATSPMVVHTGGDESWLAEAAVDLGELPSSRFGFDALRFFGNTELANLPASDVRLVFRGTMNQWNAREGRWLRAADASGGSARRSSRQKEPHLVMLYGDLVDGRLVFTVKCSRDHFPADTAALVATRTTALMATATGARLAGRAEARP